MKEIIKVSRDISNLHIGRDDDVIRTHLLAVGQAVRLPPPGRAKHFQRKSSVNVELQWHLHVVVRFVVTVARLEASCQRYVMAQRAGNRYFNPWVKPRGATVR